MKSGTNDGKIERESFVLARSCEDEGRNAGYWNVDGLCLEVGNVKHDCALTLSLFKLVTNYTLILKPKEPTKNSLVFFSYMNWNCFSFPLCMLIHTNNKPRGSSAPAARHLVKNLKAPLVTVWLTRDFLNSEFEINCQILQQQTIGIYTS